VDDLSAVQVLNAQHNLNENLPHEVLNERLTILLLYITQKITMLAILHDNVYLLIVNETV
jgi:hypothetical protein